MTKLFLLFALLIACSLACAAQKLPPNLLRVGTPAPQFSATDIDGSDYDLSQMRGKVVVLTFWSTHCAICKSELPRVNQLIRGYEGKDVVFLALTTENDEKVGNYLRSNPQAARVVPNSFGIMLSYADRDANGNLSIGYPAFFVIDKEGRLAYRGSGWDRTGPLGSTLDNLLGQ